MALSHFVICCDGAIWLVFRSFFSIVPHVDVDFVCSCEEVSSGSSYAAILDSLMFVFKL